MQRRVYGILLSSLLVALMLALNVSVYAFYCPITKLIEATLKSPGELRVLDSDGRITGLVHGRVVNEIPVSDYAGNTVTLSLPIDSYTYEVGGTSQGHYDLVVTAVTRQENATFTAEDIPVSLGTVHQYVINWSALVHGEKGVNVNVDSNGDGVIERRLTAGAELTSEEFMAASAATDLNKDGIVNMPDMTLVAAAYGSKPNNPKWNVLADMDKNGCVDILDIAMVAKDYGKAV